MNIRPATQLDIPALARLLHQVNDVHARIRPDIFILGQRKYTDEELCEVLSDPERPVFVAEDEVGEALGYAFCEVERVSRHNLQPETTLYIDDICVDESSRGQHVGTALFNYVNRFALDTGCRRITLNVWQGNDSARSFYEQMGMKPLKTVMEKIL